MFREFGFGPQDGSFIGYLGPPLMVLLNAGLDDAGGSGTGYVAYSGYIAFSGDWGAFTRDWSRVLGQKNLTHLHVKDYLYERRIQGSAAECEQHHFNLIEPFASVVHEHKLFGISVAVETASYAALTAPQKKLAGDPTALVLQVFVKTLAGWTFGLNDGAVLTFMLDESDQRNGAMLQAYRAVKRSNPEWEKLLASIGFGDDKFYPSLQAADLLGNSFHKYLKGEQLSYARLSRSELPAIDRHHVEYVFDSAALVELVERRASNPKYLPEFRASAEESEQRK